MCVKAAPACGEECRPQFQPQEWSSFSSLTWGRLALHRWSWKGHEVYGEGVSPTGVGGRWYAKGLPGYYRTVMEARAAVEALELERNPPAVSEEDVERVCEKLNAIIGSSFEELVSRSGLTEGAVSDAIARALDEGRIKIVFSRGRAFYKLCATTRMSTLR
jgi:hypothetical protein